MPGTGPAVTPGGELFLARYSQATGAAEWATRISAQWATSNTASFANARVASTSNTREPVVAAATLRQSPTPVLFNAAGPGGSPTPAVGVSTAFEFGPLQNYVIAKYSADGRALWQAAMFPADESFGPLVTVSWHLVQVNALYSMFGVALQPPAFYVATSNCHTCCYMAAM